MGQSPDSKNYTNNSSDHILVQGNADIKNGFVYPRVWTTQITKQSHSGDLIMSVRAPVGDIAKTEYDVVLGRGVCAIKGNEFIFQLLTKMKENDYWESLSTGSTFDSINSNDIKNAEIFIPSLEEQTQIGNFFKQLDDTIALHQRELEKFKILKTSYLENIFLGKVSLFTAKNTITWEQRKLGEFSKTTIGEFVIKTKQNPNSKYPVYNGGVSYTGFYDDFNNNGHKIIVSARGANAGFINIINGKYWAGNSCYSIDIQSDNYCIEYVYHFMKHKQHLFTDFQQAANIPSVSKKNVEEFLISYPRSKEEQTQIGNFFKQLDDTIALHQKELAKYQQIKTACLEKMFVE